MTRTSLLFIVLTGLSSAGFAAGLELPEPAKEHAEWQATGELGDLLEKMAASNKASQEVFEKLSAEQMNWQPPNGTHTPRWNAEHLMSIQLLFFSQVFAAIDPEHHELIKINPKQMPGDYVAAHPDWTGEQEAEQMQQISDYIQGHAYLLKDLDLDAKPPGSRWVLRALLKRMDSHYAEHTANVVKKFELAGWPKQAVVAE